MPSNALPSRYATAYISIASGGNWPGEYAVFESEDCLQEIRHSLVDRLV